MKIKKAIIPAAGLGTRVLPASKSVPKEMLNIVDKPAIQYIVEEAAAAGIEDILIITNRGKGVIEDHFDHSYELEDKLSQRCHAIHEILVSQEGNKIVAEVYPYYEEYGDEADNIVKDAVDQFNRDMPRWKNIDKLEFRSEEFPKTTTLKIRRNYKEYEKAQAEKAHV